MPPMNGPSCSQSRHFGKGVFLKHTYVTKQGDMFLVDDAMNDPSWMIFQEAVMFFLNGDAVKGKNPSTPSILLFI